MSSADFARINREMLRWAINRSGISKEALSHQFSPDQISAWLDGRAMPTHAQAEKLAEKLRVPFLVLFLSHHPELETPIPDLRTMAGTQATGLSPLFAEVINDLLVKQDWYKEFRKEQRARPLPFVGSFSITDRIEDVAASISHTIGLDDGFRQKCNTWKEFLGACIDRVEKIGILVFRSRVAGHSTRHKLSVKEFRGFVLSDEMAPLIFVNDDDAKAAQIFTLAHELAHIWINQSGILEFDLKKRPAELHNKIERFCNGVAAEVLVPSAEFNQKWTSAKSLDENVTRLSRYYRVSSLVILKRSYELSKITFAQLSPAIDSEYERFRQQDRKEEVKDAKKKKGGNFWASFVIRNSRRFTDAVVGAARNGDIRYTDAASFLGVKPATFEGYLQKP